MFDSSTGHSWFRAVQGLQIASMVFVLSAMVTGLMRVNLGHGIWQIGCGLSAIVAGKYRQVSLALLMLHS